MRNAGSAGKLRVVLDTNVLVSAFQFPHGSVAGVWRAFQERRYHLVVSPAILNEMVGILRHRFKWKDRDRKDLLKLIARRAEIVRPTELPDAVPDDPDDNHIVACAIDGRADLIVSGDRDLLRLGAYAGIPIVRPVDFLRTVEHL